MALQFNVSQLLKSGIGEIREYDFQAEEPIDLEDGVASNVRGHVKFTLTNFGIIANAHAAAQLHLTCARCLEPFGSPTEVDFEEEYQPAIDIATGLPSQVPRSDAAFIIPQHHNVDLTEAIRQNLILAVDLIPVCSATCQGLCPTCGANRNVETCDCPTVDTSSPFAALAGLFSDNEMER